MVESFPLAGRTTTVITLNMDTDGLRLKPRKGKFDLNKLCSSIGLIKWVIRYSFLRMKNTITGYSRIMTTGGTILYE